MDNVSGLVARDIILLAYGGFFLFVFLSFGGGVGGLAESNS